jgi:hypothetical protein
MWGLNRFDRAITVFRRGEGALWRRSDEHHRNMTFDPEEAVRILQDNGVDARLRVSFGEESLPDGLVVLSGISYSPFDASTGVA